MTVPQLAAIGLPVALAIRLATVALTLAVFRRTRACRLTALAGAIAASLLTLGVGAFVMWSGRAVDGVLVRHAASGIVLSYSVTPLSAWFLIIAGLVAVPVAVYSAGYFAHGIDASRTAMVGAALNVLLGALEVVFVADGIIVFLCAWELMTLSTAALVATAHEARASRRAAFLYLVMSHVGTGCLIAGFFILSAASGSTLFAAMFSGHVVAGPLRHVVSALFFVGFGVKAGIIPLHVWLPEAHPAAPSSISALMSAVLITAGIYGLVRMCAFGFGVPDARWGLAFMLVGTLSAMLGVLYALTEGDLKRLLAYSTIENAGIIVLGIGIAMLALAYGEVNIAALALGASLLHALNHAMFKGLLFLGAGSVVMATGTRRIERYGGLLRLMPWTGACFLVGALAISGLPLLNGFVSEWVTFQSLLLGFAATPGLVRLNFPLGGAMLAMTTALAAACFVRAFGISFLARPRSGEAAEAHESPALMLLPQVVLAVMCVGLGCFPGIAFSAVSRVTSSLPNLTASAAVAWSATGLVSGAAGSARPGGLAGPGGLGSFDHVTPAALGAALLGGLLLSAVLAWRWGAVVRRVPTWGCGGELTAQTEYTAKAFSKPLMMIFRSVYRPTRDVETLAEVSRYFPQEVRYRAEIEPTFERYVYGPVVRGVLRTADGMKMLQAGSLHAYLAYVLVLGVALLIWLGGPM